MNTIDILGDAFPSFEKPLNAKWAPILLEPIAGSPERLVVGCAVVSDADFHLEPANCLARLNCLYGSKADGVAFAVELATKVIQENLASKGLQALTENQSPLSGICIGSIREAEGESLRAIAQDWMSVLSSLYSVEAHMDSSLAETEVVEVQARKPADRLPSLVLEQITEMDISLAKHFSPRIIEGRIRRRSAAHKIDIDFKGDRLVANFATLQAHKITPAIGNMKQRLFDLKVDREENHFGGTGREHELIIQVPPSDDPQVTEKQLKRLSSEFDGLMEHADKLSLRLREFNTPKQIGEHIIQREAA